MDLEFCGHGLMERDKNAVAITRQLPILSNGMAHFPGVSA
jgi:hypothetical protein